MLSEEFLITTYKGLEHVKQVEASKQVEHEELHWLQVESFKYLAKINFNLIYHWGEQTLHLVPDEHYKQFYEHN